MLDITQRQQDVLNSIKKHIREEGVPPSRLDLAKSIGLGDAAAVRVHLKRLEEKGRIQVLTGKNRGIRVIEDDVPLVGPVAEVAAETSIVCDAHIVERVPAALKRLVRIDERQIELRPESHNPAHEVMRLDLAKHIVEIDGVMVGALLVGRPAPPDEDTAGDPSHASAGRSPRNGHQTAV